MRQIEFWFDFGSTYSYPAAMRIEELAAGHGIEVLWRPFLLGPIFQEQGWNDSPFNLYERRGRYMWRDLERVCAAHGLEFRRPTAFPRNGLLAARVATRFDGEAWVPDFVRAVFHANFVEDREIADPAVVADCLRRAPGSPEDRIAAAGSPESKAALRSRTAAASAAQMFGAPTFRVGDEMFWGNDRLEQALAWTLDPHPGSVLPAV